MSDAVEQSITTDRISQIGSQNPFVENNNSYITDEYEISDLAFQKYQHEQDVKYFSDILLKTDENDAIEQVLKKTFDGTISIDDDNFLAELLSNDEFLNDVFR